MVDTPELEWRLEQGIGERRWLCFENGASGGEICAAKLQWPGELSAGAVHEARLTTKRSGARRGTVVLDKDGKGMDAFVDHLPTNVNEGADGQVRIVRAPIAERGRLKLAQSRWIEGASTLDATAADANASNANAANASTLDASAAITATPTRAFAPGDWEEVWHAASSGSIAFSGGEILCSVTPAMTLIDIDGDLPPRELALAAIPAIARALRWFEIGGSIGIDFPTLQTKTDRRAVDEALAAALADWPHERTAMNGFGFVQIVARLTGPSLLHRFARSRTGMCARYAIRMAERVEGPGTTLLTVHPALKSKLKPEWLDELRRRTGREVRIETNPALALETPNAQVFAL